MSHTTTAMIVPTHRTTRRTDTRHTPHASPASPSHTMPHHDDPSDDKSDESIDAKTAQLKREASDAVDKKLAEMSATETRRAVTAQRTEKAQEKARKQRMRAEYKARKTLARGEYKARRTELKAQGLTYRTVRLDVHGRPKPLMRGWIHLFATPLALAGGIVLICLAPTTGLKWACAVYMTASLILFGNSATYHLGDWSPKVTDILRRIDHMNIFLLIAGTYTPIAFALEPQWRNTILISTWGCVAVAMVIHIIWINAPRALYTAVYVVFGVSGIAYMGLFWQSPVAGSAVVWLILAGGACYIAGAIVYAKRRPDPWPDVFGFHEVFHTCTVMGYACHMVAVFLVVCAMR